MTNFKGSLLATTLLAGVAVSGPAFAQATSPAPAPSQDPNVQAAPTDQTPAQQENVADTAAQDRQDVEPASAETIVVTGSRIVSPNIVSLAPVQVVGEQDIDKAGAVNVQGLVCTFTILTDEPDSPAVADAIEMVRTASFAAN